jgi:hypothetical protein
VSVVTDHWFSGPSITGELSFSKGLIKLVVRASNLTGGGSRSCPCSYNTHVHAAFGHGLALLRHVDLLFASETRGACLFTRQFVRVS